MALSTFSHYSFCVSLVGLFQFQHDVCKSQKKSHSTLRGKRATLTFLVLDKSSLKMPKMINFGEFLKA